MAVATASKLVHCNCRIFLHDHDQYDYEYECRCRPAGGCVSVSVSVENALNIYFIYFIHNFIQKTSKAAKVLLVVAQLLE